MKTRRDTGRISSFLALLILAVGAPLRGNCGFAAYLVRLHLIGLRVWEF
jgi:hypothetical protein